MAVGVWTVEMLEAAARHVRVPIDTSVSARVSAETDFGRLVKGRCAGVARPLDVTGLRSLLAFANSRDLPVTIRGRGLSQSGQSVPSGGLCIELSEFRQLAAPDSAGRRIRVGAAASWREVLARTVAAGLSPLVMPLNLDLSVGGTLSAGGFGSTSHHHGIAATGVTALQVVLADGNVVECEVGREAELFAALLGGVGQFGAMTEIELGLRPVPGRVRTYYLLYEDLDALIHDQGVLRDRRADHLEGFCTATVQGLRLGRERVREPFVHWLYGLHVSCEYSVDSEPSDADVLTGLTHRKLLHVEDDDALGFAARYDARFRMMRATGAWEYAHPWLEALIPPSEAPRVIREALELLPYFLGDGHRVQLVSNPQSSHSVAFPPGNLAVGFAVLPAGVPTTYLAPALEALRATDGLLLSAGGKRYLSGWLFDAGEPAMSLHYGEPRYQSLRHLKQRVDPKGIFESCLSAPQSSTPVRHDAPSF